jgi:hypothetical protein
MRTPVSGSGTYVKTGEHPMHTGQFVPPGLLQSPLHVGIPLTMPPNVQLLHFALHDGGGGIEAHEPAPCMQPCAHAIWSWPLSP